LCRRFPRHEDLITATLAEEFEAERDRAARPDSRS
jgi:hypothetical protein